MSLELDVTNIKTLVEATPLFKPASPQNQAARAELRNRGITAKRAARLKSTSRKGLSIKYLVKPIPNRQDSFWYSRDVAEIEYVSPKTGEWRKLTLSAQGDIFVKFNEGEEEYGGDDAVEEALRRGYTDKDLAKANFDNSSWFEFWYESDMWAGQKDISVMEGMDVMGDYDEGIALGVDIIQDDTKWHGITEILEESKINEQEEPLFKPATLDQQAMRLYPNDQEAREKYIQSIKTARTEKEREALRFRQQEEIRKAQRRVEAARIRAFYAALPYTYDDIVKLNAYDKIMHMGKIEDVTSDIMKVHRTTCFRLIDTSAEYAAYANGYLRSNPRGVHPSAIKKLHPAMTIEAYGKLLDQLCDVITKAIIASEKEVAYYKYRVTDAHYKPIETVYYKRKVDSDYVKNSLIADGYDPGIHVMWAGFRRGERVRENANA